MAINKSTGEGESICAHIPTAWVRINPPAVRELTDEQRKAIGEKLLLSRQNGVDDCK
ncbi:Uncharacterised protein [uncultured Ruminococcus sp.]|nr:Uncharacterised protein [uncultured Ruminococcus sp.]